MKRNTSVWLDGVKEPSFKALESEIQAEVAVIGSGIAGLTTAYLLTKAGKNVVLLEQSAVITSGATAYTTAFLTTALDTDYATLIRIYGQTKAQAIVQSHVHAIDAVAAIVRAESIDCDFLRLPMWEYAWDEDEWHSLRHHRVTAQELDISTTEHVGALGNLASQAAVEYPNQAIFHPIKYLQGLLRAATKQGLQVYDQSQVTDIVPDAASPVPITGTGAGVVVQTKDGSVRAAHVVVAAYGELLPTSLFIKKGTYKTYVYAGTLPKDTLPIGLYEDTHNPYHYLRIEPGETKGGDERFVFGGEDHRADIPVDPERHWKALKQELERIIGRDHAITHRWDGPILEPVDGLAFIGSAGNGRMHYATGFSGTGMTYGTIAGHVLADTILKQSSYWRDEVGPLYRANRTPTLTSLLLKGRDYLGELWGGALKNLFVR